MLPLIPFAGAVSYLGHLPSDSRLDLIALASARISLSARGDALDLQQRWITYHVGTMVFCTYCGQSFTRDEHLERHILTRMQTGTLLKKSY